MIVLIILLLIAAILFINITLEYSLLWDLRGKQVQRIQIKALFFKKKINIVKRNAGTKSGLVIRDSVDIIRDALRRVKVRSFHARAEVGLGDAFVTAMSCGAAQAAGNLALSFILPDNKQYLQKYLKVLPNFDRECLDMSVGCIVSVKIANIIPVVIKFLKTSKRSDGIASNRKHDENHYGGNTRDDRRQHHSR